MTSITQIIRQKTNGRYEDLRLRSATFFKDKLLLDLVFSSISQLNEGQKEEICHIVNNEEFAMIKFSVDFVIDDMNAHKLIREIKKWTKKECYSIYRYIEDGEQVLSVIDREKFIVNFFVDSDMAKHIEQTQYIEKLREHINSVTAKVVNFNVSENEEDEFNLQKALEDIEYRQNLAQLVSMGTPKREINIQVISAVIGKQVTGSPMYIIDVKEGDVVVCGKVFDLNVINVNKENSKVKKIYKYIIGDFTGRINLVYYAKDDDKNILKVHLGDHIVVYGKASINSYDNAMQVVIRCISFCRLIEGDKPSVYDMPPNDNYIVIKPTAYIKATQQSLFEEEKAVQKTKSNYVVIDFETTGLNAVEDKIIEVGAVKIENGKITQVFSTFVNPERPISAQSTVITGITDEMVKNAPIITAIIPDLYKFCYGCTLVAHNMNFDFAFLQYYSEPTGFVFNNPREDTIVVAKEFFKRNQHKYSRPNNYKLVTVANSLGVNIVESHRAYDDARVCAEVFIKMKKNDM